MDISDNKKRNNIRKSDLYGNCEMYCPDGNLLIRCREKKANWYLNRNDEVTGKPLAIKLEDRGDGVLRFQLTFHPEKKSNPNDLYSLAKKDNKCVVCGSEENLTKHHIVPSEYRKYLPDEYKSRNSHDVVPICYYDHNKYEVNFADDLKYELADKYGAPLDGIKKIDAHLNRVISIAFALKKHGHKMPIKKVFELERVIEDYFQVSHVEDKHFKYLTENDELDVTKQIEYHGKMVVSKLTDIQEFVEMWRQHFLDNTKPQYMPLHWDVKRPAEGMG